MTNDTDIDELELTDSELVTVVKNHGIGRRALMSLLGIGVLGSTVSSTAAGKHEPQHTPFIDPHFGYSAPSDEKLPRKLQPDHVVELHVHEHAIFSPDPTDIPFHFGPLGLQIAEGDIVRFDFTTPEHTVTGYHQEQGRVNRVPNDVPPFSSPVISGGGFWLYQFDSPGTYDIFCAPHEPFGMVMRLVVGDPDSDDYDGTFEQTGRPPFSRAELNLVGVPEFPFPTPNELFQTDAMSVQNITNAGSGGVSTADVEADLADLPIVTKLVPSESSGNSTDAEFDIMWEVRDPANNLDELQLLLIDTDSSPPGPEGPPATASFSGGSVASGTTTLVASGDEGTGHTYVVESTVADSNSNSSSVAVPVTEDSSI